jgi:hypothetical protein
MKSTVGGTIAPMTRDTLVARIATAFDACAIKFSKRNQGYEATCCKTTSKSYNYNARFCTANSTVGGKIALMTCDL